MNSDTESLAFMEEDDVSPPPKNTPPAEVARPRIMAMPRPPPQLPSPTQGKPPAPAKPPLHNAAPAPTKTSALIRPTPTPAAAAAKAKAAKADADFSDNESIMFSMDNNSMSGTPMRDGSASLAQSAAAAAVLRGPAARRLSRAASNASIHFHSEPGSRTTSPSGRQRESGLRGSTPAEKAHAPHSPPPPIGRTNFTNDSISFVVEHSDGSEPQLGEASPNQYTATMRGGPSVAVPVRLPTAVGAVPGGSMISNDSIAFQIDEDSDAKAPSAKSPATPPLARAVTTTPSAVFSAKSEPRVAAPTSVADTSHSEFVDNGSIAFEVMDEATAGAVAAHRASSDAAATTTTPSPPKRPSAIPYYNSHARRSHSAQSRLDSRPNSPSIQFETDHNSDNDTALDHSSSQFGGEGSPPLGSTGLPRFDRRASPPSFPLPDVMATTSPVKERQRTTGGDGDARNEEAVGNASTTTSTKKTVVTNHLQRRSKQQQQQPSSRQRNSRLPSPQPQNPVHLSADRELSTTPSTHPPLYQKTAVSTPIAAQAAGAANDAKKDRRSSSLSDRNLPKKKDPSAMLALHHPPPTRRSKESATTESQGASPNAKLFTEAGSTGTTDSPVEPPHTGRHSRTSTDIHASSQQGVSGRQTASSHPNSVQGYLENQEAENDYHRHELTHHARRGSRTDRVLYREVSPSQEGTDVYVAPAGYRSEANSQEAEQWRRFNEQQRSELAELRHRIALARRQDRTLLENTSAVQGMGAASSARSRRGSANALLPQHQHSAPQALSALPGWNQSGPRYSEMKQKPAQAAAAAQKRTQNAQLVSPAAEKRNTSPQYRVHPGSRPSPQPSGNGTARYAQQMSSLLSSAHPPLPSSRSTGAAGTTGATSAHTSGLLKGHVRAGAPASSFAPSAHASSDLIHSPAAAMVADMLGILWPPRMPPGPSSRTNRTLTFPNNALSTELYFVNGSRLTPSQVDRFVDLVHVQAQAEEKKTSSTNFMLDASDITLSPQSYRHFSPTNALLRREGTAHADSMTLNARDAGGNSGNGKTAGSLSSAHGQRSPLSAKMAALLPKKAVRRSRVMREVFDVMDLKHQGTLHVDLLHSLSRLFEGELTALEQARTALLKGKATSLATLLGSAMASREQYAAAWGGGRGGGGAADQTSVGGLSQVLAADGVGLTVEAQEELLSLTHRLLLLSFAVNVAIPIASASRIPLLDFPTLCMILYAAVDNAEHAMDFPQEQWREVVQQYFVLLDS